jgi:hypothetical protein
MNRVPMPASRDEPPVPGTRPIPTMPSEGARVDVTRFAFLTATPERPAEGE